MEPTNTEEVVAQQPVVDPAIGVADGHVDNGERIVYELDEETGEVISWHKERLTLADKVEMGNEGRTDG